MSKIGIPWHPDASWEKIMLWNIDHSLHDNDISRKPDWDRLIAGLRTAVKCLPKELRDIVKARYVEKKTCKEIAEKLRIPVSQIQSDDEAILRILKKNPLRNMIMNYKVGMRKSDPCYEAYLNLEPLHKILSWNMIINVVSAEFYNVQQIAEADPEDLIRKINGVGVGTAEKIHNFARDFMARKRDNP